MSANEKQRCHGESNPDRRRDNPVSWTVGRWHQRRVRKCESAKVRKCESAKVRKCESAKVRIGCETAYPCTRYRSQDASELAAITARSPPSRTSHSCGRGGGVHCVDHCGRDDPGRPHHRCGANELGAGRVCAVVAASSLAFSNTDASAPTSFLRCSRTLALSH